MAFQLVLLFAVDGASLPRSCSKPAELSAS
jgi:hypothetical protein